MGLGLAVRTVFRTMAHYPRKARFQDDTAAEGWQLLGGAVCALTSHGPTPPYSLM